MTIFNIKYQELSLSNLKEIGGETVCHEEFVGKRFFIKHGYVSIPMVIWKHQIPNEPSSRLGLYDGNIIQCATYGSKKNDIFHRGGILGTIKHEFCHALQYLATTCELPNWYWSYENDQQDELYRKWYDSFGNTYAQKSAVEAAAEAFRVLSGHPHPDEWETNSHLLDDYRKFFENELVFKDFIK